MPALIKINKNEANMKTIKYFAIVIFTVAFFFNGCAQSTVKSISVSQLRDDMKSDSSLVVLDVRTPQELSGPLGKIDGVINIPLQVLDQRMNELEKYKDRKIAVICRTGHRSGIASEMLAKKGYNVENVLGGMTEYRKTE